MSTILIGVDESTRSEDAIAFGNRLAGACGAHVVVACAFPFNDAIRDGSGGMYRRALAEQAEQTARDHARPARRGRRRPPADQDHAQPLGGACASRHGASRARRAHGRRLIAHRAAGTGRAGEHGRAAAPRRSVRRRDRPRRLRRAHRATDPPDRRRLRRLRRGDRGRRRSGRAGSRPVRRARDHRGRRAPHVRGLRHDGRRGLRHAAGRARSATSRTTSTPSSPDCPTTSRPTASGSPATRPTSSASAAKAST